MKKFTKPLVACILVLAMSMSLAGCGNSAAKEAGNEIMDLVVNNKTRKIAKHFEDDDNIDLNESFIADYIDEALYRYDLEDKFEDAEYELANIEVDDDVADFEYTVTVDGEEYTFEFTLEIDDEDWYFEDDADFLASYTDLVFSALYDIDHVAREDLRVICDFYNRDPDEIGELFYERYVSNIYLNYSRYCETDYAAMEAITDEISNYM